MISEGQIITTASISDDQVQPASLDLRLGNKAYRVRASFLPGPGVTVEDKIKDFGMHEIDLSQTAVLEKDCVYIVPLVESLNLASDISGLANPKSSTGRLDIFTRLITDGPKDGFSQFDRVRAGYSGPLYAEISPRAFSVALKQGATLNQLRLRQGESAPTDKDTRLLHQEVGLTDSPLSSEQISGGVPFSVSLRGSGDDKLIGYRAKRHTGVVNLDNIAHYDWQDFWEPLYEHKTEGLVLNPGDFYKIGRAHV